MTSFLVTIVAFVVALACLIVIHELGHYAIARACGVKVLRFSVGFGRPLWKRSLGRDGTEWVVAAFPVGGYVKMLDEREGPVDAPEAHRAFNRQSVWRRFAIVVAGPAANFLLAIVLYWGLYLGGVPGIRAVVEAPPPGSPAAAAGFSGGDTVLAVEGERAATWQDARWLLLKRAVERGTANVEVRTADGRIAWRTLDFSGLTAADLDGDFLRGLGLSRQQPRLDPVIGEAVEGGAARRAGLEAGDRILAIDGKPVERWSDVVRAVRASPGGTLRFDLERGGARLQLAVTTETVLENGRPIGRIGAAPRVDRSALSGLLIEVSYGPGESLVKALQRTWDTSVFSLRMLGKMVVGDVSLRNLSGPITIADYAGQSAQSGAASYLLFIALISISLGVLNLLPIPLLDGGHLMYYTIEIFKGRPISERAMEIGQHVGIALLFTLMAFALYNDITRLLVSG